MKMLNSLVKKYKPNKYYLNLDLTLLKERRFHGRLIIDGEKLDKDNCIILNSKNLTINWVKLNDKKATFKLDNDILIINSPKQAGSANIEIDYSGKIIDSMHGLYPSYYLIDEKQSEMFSTQFESHYAREVLPCVDEPSAKAIFELIIKTDKKFDVLSNMSLARSKIEGDSRQHFFMPTPKMSSYLLAFAVGEFRYVSGKSRSGVDVKVWSHKGHKKQDLDFALNASIKILDFYEDYFGVKYPLSKIDHIAIPDFSAGAMENWGLITYREDALIAGNDSTTLSKQSIAKVIAHELAHQWFGNLVTMQWWNDLWLNESFASIIEYVAVDAIYPNWNIWQDFSSHEVVSALGRDCYKGVQAVRTDVNDPEEISSLFDGAIVYSKGARLLKMLINYLGDEDFRTGIRRYFNKHAYQNTTANDLWEALEESSHKNVRDFMNTWINQPGYPLVTFKNKHLTQEQYFIGKRDRTKRHWPIPLDSSNPKVPKIMDKKSLKISASDFRLNIHNASHFITLYDKNNYLQILNKIKSNDLDEISKMQFFYEQILLARGGKRKYVDLFSLIYLVSSQNNYRVWFNISHTTGDIYKFLIKHQRERKIFDKILIKTCQAQFSRLGISKIQGEAESDHHLRALIISILINAHDAKIVKALYEIYKSQAIEDIDPDLRASVLRAAIKISGSEKIINELMSKHRTTTSPDLKDDIMFAITTCRDKTINAKMFENLKDKTVVKPQDIILWLSLYQSNIHNRDAAWKWIRHNWTWLEDTFKDDHNLEYLPRIVARHLTTADELAEYSSFFMKYQNNKLLSRSIKIGKNEIANRVKLYESEGKEVRDYLLKLEPTI